MNGFNHKLDPEWLESYLLHSKKYLKPESENLKYVLSFEKIIIYGAGGAFDSFLNLTDSKYKLKEKIDMVLDKKFSCPTKYKGIPALSFQYYKPTETMLKDFLVIITISDKSIQNEVKLILSSMGHQNIICCSDVPEFNFVYFPKEFVLSPEKFYTKQIDKILNAFCLFKDKISKEIYIKFIRLYLEKQPQIFPYDNVNFQYFPFDIPIPKSNYHYFLDGGAYNGDTVLKLINSLGKIKNLICFEPSKNNFIRLNTFLHRKKRKIADNILSCPFGLWEKTTRLLFKDAGPDSHIRENIISREDSFVPVVAIDDILIDYPIKFIKMDIEGAELKALIGAEKIIQRLKPTLAICVYHTPNHIWEIPLFLNQLKLNYNFFLRAYSFFGIEIVLYAV